MWNSYFSACIILLHWQIITIEEKWPVIKRERVQQQSQQRVSLQPYLRMILLSSLFPCRRLLTQLEAAKGSRGGTVGDSKPASAKGPDGVVLYELHSRPEQEKFTESAKVQRMNVSADTFTFIYFLTCFPPRVCLWVWWSVVVYCVPSL